MAKTFRKMNHLKKDYYKYRIAGAGSFVISAASIITIGRFAIVTSILIFIATIALGTFLFKKSKIIKIGWKGEEKASRVYAKLPDSFYVLSDLYITFDGKTSQIDHVVIGDNGVFVIETKNINGIIEGNENDNKIIQYKTGRNGGSYTKEHYNPMKQVSTHVYRVAKLLRKNKIDIWVQGIVYFANEDAQVKIHYQDIPVFSAGSHSEKSIIRYLTSFEQGKKRLSKNDKDKIVRVLKDNK